MRGLFFIALCMMAAQLSAKKPVVNRIIEKKRGKVSLLSKMEYKIIYYTEEGKRIVSVSKEHYNNTKVGDTVVYNLAYKPQ